ncbi:MAG: nucleotidyl transferase AbiEii/AbiGii toxin family protein [Caldilineaceae bacterium]|nr:nucleotidyl transferase AbiEii/AbiGii toxin family protein [Caldilineaceae bacterium]
MALCKGLSRANHHQTLSGSNVMNDTLKGNVTASVRQRLLDLRQQRQEDFSLILTQFAIERLLYRLSQSSATDQFVLKGATLFLTWTGKLHRPTQDLDLLGYGNSSTDSLRAIFTDVCTLVVEADGLRFEPNTITVSEIREGMGYGVWVWGTTCTVGCLSRPRPDTAVNRYRFRRRCHTPSGMDKLPDTITTSCAMLADLYEGECHCRKSTRNGYAGIAEQPYERFLRSLDSLTSLPIRRHRPHPSHRSHLHPAQHANSGRNTHRAHGSICRKPNEDHTVEDISPAQSAGRGRCVLCGYHYGAFKISTATYPSACRINPIFSPLDNRREMDINITPALPLATVSTAVRVQQTALDPPLWPR